MNFVYNAPVEVHAGEDVPFEADYDSDCDDAPDLSGATFEFTAVPTDATGATITKTCTILGTKIQWTVARADLADRLDEVFRCQVRRTNTGSNRVWLQFEMTVVN